MKKLLFEDTQEFAKLFKERSEAVTDSIVESIQDSLTFQKKTAKLFEIKFQNVELSYEITLPSTQWNIALTACLEHYEELEEGDKALDVYLLKKEVTKWLD